MKEFFPKGYKLPKTSGNYTKLEKGKTKVRILGNPLIGWLDWVDNKPIRSEYNIKPEPADPSKPVRHFWAFKIWNYNIEKVQIWEITQSTIQGIIQSLFESPDWGSPTLYDLEITRTGESMETKYSVVPSPPKDLTIDIQKKVDEVQVDLEKLLGNLDPFSFEPTSKRDAIINEDGDVPIVEQEDDEINLSDIPF